VYGQKEARRQLETFVRDAKTDGSAAFVFHGPTGVGKTASAWALAEALGCQTDYEELGGVYQVPSGKQDGRAVEDLWRALHLRPLWGSGWRVAIINEADRMTDQAEMIWLDALEELPNQCIVIFTTNDPSRLSARLLGRCELVRFLGDGPGFTAGIGRLVRKVWEAETGEKLRRLPKHLGRLELGSGELSMRVALQQIAPYLRRGDPLPDELSLPIVHRQDAGSAAAKKAWGTRRRRAAGTYVA
jgi:hypothetical protein